MLVPVQADDPRVDAYRGLTDIAYRKSHEAETGVFLAESMLVIDRALECGHRMLSALTGPRTEGDLLASVGDRDVPVFAASEEALCAITGYRVHRGPLALFARPALPSVGEVTAGARLVVALEDLVDHTNVGAIIRSAVAMGADAALVSPRCADPLYRRSVRVSMGSILGLPWTRAVDWPGDLHRCRDGGLTVIGLTPDPSAVDLETVSLSPATRAVVVIGTEGAGMSKDAMDSCDVLARIAMSGNPAVDSLNAAAASAVAFYSIGRRLGLLSH